MLYITSPVLFYLIIGILYLLTTFLQSPHLIPCISGNHKSDLFFLSLVLLLLFLDSTRFLSFLWPINISFYVNTTTSLSILFCFLICFWLCWVFVAACGLSVVVVSRGYFSLLQCVGFSLRWLFLLRSMGSRGAGLSSCSTWAQ